MAKTSKSVIRQYKTTDLVAFDNLYMITKDKKKIYLKDLTYIETDGSRVPVTSYDIYLSQYDHLRYGDIDPTKDIIRKVAYYTPAPKYFVDKQIDVKSEDGEDTTKYIRNKVYVSSSNGDHVAVQIEGNDYLTNVSISQLYIDDETPLISEGEDTSSDSFKAKLDGLVGTSLKVKREDGKFVSTHPISINRYSVRSQIVEADDDEKRMEEGSYVRLKNGKFVRERDLTPKSYKVTDDRHLADAFFVKLKDPDGYCIVDKEFFNNSRLAAGKSFKWGNKIVTVDQFKPIIRTNSINAEIIQVKSKEGDTTHHCRVVKAISEIVPSVDEDAREKALSDFATHYKSGDYVLDRTEVKNKDGETVQKEIDARHRYVVSDHVDVVDNTEKKLALKYNPIKMQAKDGQISIVTGGPKYSYLKALKRDFGVWGNAASGLLGLYSSFGIFAVIAMPAVVIASAAAVAVAPVGILVGEAVATAVKNNNILSDDSIKRLEKTEAQNQEEIKDIEKGLHKIYEDTAEILDPDKRAEIVNKLTSKRDKLVAKIEKAQKAKGLSGLFQRRNLAKLQKQKEALDSEIERKDVSQEEIQNRLAQACGETEARISTVAGATVSGGEFIIKDGVGDVTAENAYQALRYKHYYEAKVKERKELAALISMVEVQHKKGKKLDQKTQEKLTAALSKYHPEDTLSDDVENNLDILRDDLTTIDNHIESISENYNSGNYGVPSDPKYQALIDNNHTMQALLLAKMNKAEFLEEVYPESAIDDMVGADADPEVRKAFIAEQGKILDALSFDPVKGVYKYNGKVIDLDMLADANGGDSKDRKKLMKKYGFKQDSYSLAILHAILLGAGKEEMDKYISKMTALDITDEANLAKIDEESWRAEEILDTDASLESGREPGEVLRAGDEVVLVSGDGVGDILDGPEMRLSIADLIEKLSDENFDDIEFLNKYRSEIEKIVAQLNESVESILNGEDVEIEINGENFTISSEDCKNIMKNAIKLLEPLKKPSEAENKGREIPEVNLSEEQDKIAKTMIMSSQLWSANVAPASDRMGLLVLTNILSAYNNYLKMIENNLSNEDFVIDPTSMGVSLDTRNYIESNIDFINALLEEINREDRTDLVINLMGNTVTLSQDEFDKLETELLKLTGRTKVERKGTDISTEEAKGSSDIVDSVDDIVDGDVEDGLKPTDNIQHRKKNPTKSTEEKSYSSELKELAESMDLNSDIGFNKSGLRNFAKFIASYQRIKEDASKTKYTWSEEDVILDSQIKNLIRNNIHLIELLQDRWKTTKFDENEPNIKYVKQDIHAKTKGSKFSITDFRYITVRYDKFARFEAENGVRVENSRIDYIPYVESDVYEQN